MTATALLKFDSPWRACFPDGKVPLHSPEPMRLRGDKSPLCFLVAGYQLKETQVERIAQQLLNDWHPECSDLDEASEYICQHDGFPLACDHFKALTVNIHQFNEVVLAWL